MIVLLDAINALNPALTKNITPFSQWQMESRRRVLILLKDNDEKARAQMLADAIPSVSADEFFQRLDSSADMYGVLELDAAYNEAAQRARA